jgi:glyoxylase-like metal-dependent hydrolase (beta-lactamase superfamily II)
MNAAAAPATTHDEVLPGVWWLRGTRGCNVFIAEADDGSLFAVDTGFGDSAEAILAAVTEIGRGRPLAHLLITHAHADHAGAAEAIVSATGARVAAGVGDCRATASGWELRPHLVRGPGREGGVAVALAIDGECEVLPGVRAVPTPGHTPGSVCFLLDRAGAAFVGDLVIIHGTELTRPLRRANHDDALYLRTLRVFADAAPGACLPGHGPPLLSGFDARLRELADLPRRSALNPRGFYTRMRRLAGFSRGVGSRRQGRSGTLES